MKPPSCLRLIKGKLIDTFDGFVDTFNWITKFLYYLKSSSGSIAISHDPDDRYSLDIAGASDAATGTVPTKTDGGIAWQAASANPDEATVTNSQRADGKLSIMNAYDAASNTVPVMKSDGSLEWKPYNEGEEVELSFRGTDGTSATGSTVRFESADDSAITTSVSKDGNVVVVKIGVHWKV